MAKRLKFEMGGDELLLSWQLSNDKKQVMLCMSEESNYTNYEIDLEKKEVKRYGYK